MRAQTRITIGNASTTLQGERPSPHFTMGNASLRLRMPSATLREGAPDPNLQFWGSQNPLRNWGWPVCSRKRLAAASVLQQRKAMPWAPFASKCDASHTHRRCAVSHFCCVLRLATASCPRPVCLRALCVLLFAASCASPQRPAQGPSAYVRCVFPFAAASCASPQRPRRMTPTQDSAAHVSLHLEDRFQTMLAP